MIINPQLLFCFRNPVLLSWRASLRQPSWSWIWKSASSVGWLGATHRPAQQAACLWRLSSAVCQLRLESKTATVSSAFASSWQAMPRHSPLAAPKRKLFLIQQRSPSSSKAWALQRKHSHGLSLLQGWTIAIAIQLLTLPMLQQSQLDIPPLRPFAPSIRPCLSISERPSLHYESSRRDSENCPVYFIYTSVLILYEKIYFIRMCVILFKVRTPHSSTSMSWPTFFLTMLMGSWSEGSRLYSFPWEKLR